MNSAVRVVFVVLMSVGVANAIDLPWKSSKPSLEPRDKAFAPVVVAPSGDGVQWGVPLLGGPIRALVIAPRFTLRDAAEIAQRLEIRAEALPLWTFDSVGRPDDFPREIPGTDESAFREQLHEHLRRELDVIIIANVDFDVFSPEDCDAIAQKVRDGAGLLLAHHRKGGQERLVRLLEGFQSNDATSVVAHGIGERLTGEWQQGINFVQTGTVGNGRVVELDYPGERPLHHCLIPALANPGVAEREHFDAYLSLVARAARWAAGRDVAPRVESVERIRPSGPEQEQIPPGLEDMVETTAQPGASMIHRYVIQLKEAAPETYAVRTQIRQPGRGQPPVINTARDAVLRKGETRCETFVVAGAGDYWLDVWLLDKDKVVEWHTETIHVDTWPSIGDFTVSKTSVLPQDSVGVSFTMPARPRPCVALVRATDPHDRVVAATHQAIPPDTGYVQLGLKFTDIISDIVKLEVFASDRNSPVMPDWDTRFCAYAHRWLPVRGLPPSYRIHVSTRLPRPPEFNLLPLLEGLASSGFSAAVIEPRDDSSRLLAHLGFKIISQVAAYTPLSVDNANVRMPCFADPAFAAAEAERLPSLMEAVRDFNNVAVTLGSGNALAYGDQDVCRSTASLNAFAEYLQRVYGDIDALNAAWGVRAETWADAKPPTLEQARAAGALAGWVDFRLFMDDVFLNSHLAAHDAIRSADLRARIGLEPYSSPSPYTGVDWRALVTRMDYFVAPPEPYFAAVARARGESATFAFSLPRGELTPGHLRRLPWYALFNRAQVVQWPDVLADAWQVPPAVSVDPFGMAAPFAPEFLAELEAIQSIAPLMLRAVPQRSGVAIYSNRASAWINTADPQFADSIVAERAYVSVLTGLGYSVDVIGPDAIQRDRLPEYRALILPMVRALSEHELAAIQQAHQNGCAIIADIAPGTYNEHGVRRSAPPLAALFGATYRKPSEASRHSESLAEISMSGDKASAEFTDLVVDGAVEPADAAVGGIAGMAPVWLHRRGPALAVLTNVASTPAAIEQARSLIDAVLREAGAIRAMDVARKGNHEFSGDRYVSSFGSATLYGFLAAPDAADTQKIRMQFPRDKTVYNVLTKIREMRPGNVTAELAPGAAALYAELPYELTTCALTAPPQCVVGSRLPLHVALETSEGVAATHVVRIEVYALRPEGIVPLDHYFTDLVCTDGHADGYIPIALSERLGALKIVARDIITGLTGEAVVSLAKVKQT